MLAGGGQAMQNRILAEVRAYWEGLRKGRAVPGRAEVNPRGIERALEYAFILERIAPGMARFRLAGMHLNDVLGMEVRGMPLSAFFMPEARKQISQVLEEMFQHPAVAELGLVAEAGFGKPALTARLLLLPLSSDFGDVNRALGCLVSEGKIGRTPRRFVVSSAQCSPILAGTPIEASAVSPIQISDLASSAPRHAAPGLAEAPSCFASTPEARRALLRLVKSDE